MARARTIAQPVEPEAPAVCSEWISPTPFTCPSELESKQVARWLLQCSSLEALWTCAI